MSQWQPNPLAGLGRIGNAKPAEQQGRTNSRRDCSFGIERRHSGLARARPRGGVAHQEASDQEPTDLEMLAVTDPQLKSVLRKMAAQGILHPTTVEDVCKTYLFYPTVSGKPEHVFRVRDRLIPGSAGSV